MYVFWGIHFQVLYYNNLCMYFWGYIFKFCTPYLEIYGNKFSLCYGVQDEIYIIIIIIHLAYVKVNDKIMV